MITSELEPWKVCYQGCNKKINVCILVVVVCIIKNFTYKNIALQYLIAVVKLGSFIPESISNVWHIYVIMLNRLVGGGPADEAKKSGFSNVCEAGTSCG